MNKIDYNLYLKKLKGCYIGKCVGGTLGMPFEGNVNTQNLTYYDPIPNEMCGNDDLDLQIIYVESIYRYGLPINRHHIAKGWNHMKFGPDEYGVAKYHLAQGLFPPASGYYENEFKNCLGATIRSEIWAALAPGNPELAVSFAWEDACTDHTDDGINSAIFMTALESAAYTESDRDKLLEIAFSFIPKDSTLYTALQDVISLWESGKSLFETREIIIEKYGDYAGWTDCVTNVPFILMGWLYGEGDFGKSICAAVNCGFDADCTGATLGALLGLINPDSIDEKWIAPIGDDIIVSDNIIGVHIADKLDTFCDRIASLAVKCQDYYKSNCNISDIPQDTMIKSNHISIWTKYSNLVKNHTNGYESLILTTPLLVNLTYPNEIGIYPDENPNYILHIANPTEASVNVKLDLNVPNGFFCDFKMEEFSLSKGEEKSFDFHINTKSTTKLAINDLDIIINANGLDLRVNAPIIIGIPWVNVKTNELEFSRGFIKNIPSTEVKYQVNFKVPNRGMYAVACTASRDVEVYIDNNLIISGGTSNVRPSVHRGSARPIKIVDRYAKATIKIKADKDGNDGQFFFAIGNLDTWIWDERVEWKPSFRQD